jgi:uncharacterized membrane protein required for colicin V production
MALYGDFHFYWTLFEVVNGLVISILSALDIYVLYKHKRDKSPLVRWTLNEKNSKNDFSVLLFASLLFIVVFIVYSLGSLVSSDSIKIAADLIGTVTYLMVSYVIIEWSRVFLGFI